MLVVLSIIGIENEVVVKVHNDQDQDEMIDCAIETVCQIKSNDIEFVQIGEEQ